MNIWIVQESKLLDFQKQWIIILKNILKIYIYFFLIVQNIISK